MQRADIRFLQRITSITGWLLVGLAALDALAWFLSYPTARGIRDFGVEAARVSYYAVLSIPPLLVVSALLRFSCRCQETTVARYIFWGLFGFTLLLWLFAYGGLFRPTKGRDIFLGGARADANFSLEPTAAVPLHFYRLGKYAALPPRSVAALGGCGSVSRYTALAGRGERASPARLRCFRLDCFASQSYFVAQSKQP